VGSQLDLLVIGSGVAGLSAAVRAGASEAGLRVGILTKGLLADSATQWAQGGVAAVLQETAADSTRLHADDTIRAGAGLCDFRAVETLVTEGPQRVRELAALGAVFDRDRKGGLHLAREGGHSAARVVHAGGAATGAEVERALVEAARQSAAEILEEHFAVDLIVKGGRCRGVIAHSRGRGTVRIEAANTLLATGGAGQMYSTTTNPPQSTGDGVAMALRSGVAVADVEFVQFHPTALYGTPAGPRPLLSEALRGEGAILRDRNGDRFVDELAPRDVVAAALASRMAEQDADHLWLDVSPVDAFEQRFPTLAASVRNLGLDPGRDWLPVAPAAHYICGGVLTDLDGATTLPGLWAAGETACTGVHGANRLASNSLLEGMVFAARAVEAILEGKDHAGATGALQTVLAPGEAPDGAVSVETLTATLRLPRHDAATDEAKGRDRLQHVMTAGAGVLRSASSLAVAKDEVAAIWEEGVPPGELANLLSVATAVIEAALAREESRGGHRRSDFPDTRDSFAKRLVQWAG
jgi:L-aspartate oxidase